MVKYKQHVGTRFWTAKWKHLRANGWTAKLSLLVQGGNSITVLGSRGNWTTFLRGIICIFVNMPTRCNDEQVESYIITTSVNYCIIIIIYNKELCDTFQVYSKA